MVRLFRINSEKGSKRFTRNQDIASDEVPGLQQEFDLLLATTIVFLLSPSKGY